MHYYRYLSWGSFWCKIWKAIGNYNSGKQPKQTWGLTRRLQIKDHVVTEISELGAVLDKNLDKVKIDEILSSERKKSLEYLKENL